MQIMVAPAVIAAGITAAGALGSAYMGSRSQTNPNRRLDQSLGYQQLSDARKPIRRLTEDAVRAGIHPLYALGVTSSPSTAYIPGQAPQGNYIGEGIEQATRAIGKGITQAPVQAAQIRSLNASAERDEAQAAATNSETARKMLLANAMQDQIKQPRVLLPKGPSTVRTPWGEDIPFGNRSTAQQLEDLIGGFWSEVYSGFGHASDMADHYARKVYKSGAPTRKKAKAKRKKMRKAMPEVMF